MSDYKAEPKHYFSVASIPDLTNTLTAVQKKLLEEVWNRFVNFGTSYPLRSLPSIIGKQSPEDALKGLNGSLIYETTEQLDRCFKLTLYGALLTEYGSVLAVHLVQLLDLVKELYEEDTFIKELNRNQIMDRLNLSDADAKILFKLLNLGLPPGMPIYLSSCVPDGSDWTITITDEIMTLFRSDETVKYLNERLSAEYQPYKPCLYNERLVYESQRGAITNPLNTFSAITDNSWGQNRSPYINLARLEELKSIKNTSFDCTRLICICEELNECASRNNAHAVIMLTRAILDHVPPVFQCKNFAGVASNYGGGKSFKDSMERLDCQSRKVADRLLHMPIRDKEVVPYMTEVSFTSEIETLLSEFCRLLK